jgi:hypothetical protein
MGAQIAVVANDAFARVLLANTGHTDTGGTASVAGFAVHDIRLVTA